MKITTAIIDHNISSVNRFYKLLCRLKTVVLRGETTKAGNRKINANLLFRCFIVSYESWCVIKRFFISTIVNELPQVKNFDYPLCVSSNCKKAPYEYETKRLKN